MKSILLYIFNKWVRRSIFVVQNLANPPQCWPWPLHVTSYMCIPSPSSSPTTPIVLSPRRIYFSATLNTRHYSIRQCDMSLAISLLPAPWFAAATLGRDLGPEARGGRLHRLGHGRKRERKKWNKKCGKKTENLIWIFQLKRVIEMVFIPQASTNVYNEARYAHGVQENAQ